MLLGFDKVGLFIKHSSAPVSTGQRTFWGQEDFQTKVDLKDSAEVVISWDLKNSKNTITNVNLY